MLMQRAGCFYTRAVVIGSISGSGLVVGTRRNSCIGDRLDKYEACTVRPSIVIRIDDDTMVTVFKGKLFPAGQGPFERIGHMAIAS